MEDTEQIISTFLKNAVDETNKNKKETTFLSTIGKSYYETYLSKMALYALTAQNGLLVELIDLYSREKEKDWEKIDNSKLKIKNYCTEKAMGGGRADIFIEMEYKSAPFTLTIENKSLTEEHSTGEDISQTETYENYVNQHYTNSKNVFFYLKPSFNVGEPSSAEFVTITYEELDGFLDGDNDYIISDFKKHIGGYLKKMSITEDEKKYLANYIKINEFLRAADGKLTSLKANIIKELKEQFNVYGKKIIWQPYESNKIFNEASKGDIVMEKADSDKTFKLYEKNNWYNGNEDNLDEKQKYYFYCELKFNGNSLIDIVIQNAVKVYGDIDSDVFQYIDQQKPSREGKKDAGLYIFEQESFKTGYDFLSEAWIGELTNWVKVSFEKYYKEMATIFNDFSEWEKGIINNF